MSVVNVVTLRLVSLLRKSASKSFITWKFVVKFTVTMGYICSTVDYIGTCTCPCSTVDYLHVHVNVLA